MVGKSSPTTSNTAKMASMDKDPAGQDRSPIPDANEDFFFPVVVYISLESLDH